MASSSQDLKPVLTQDGHDVFNIPVEEEVLEVSASLGQSKVWAMKVRRSPFCHPMSSINEPQC